MQTKPKNAYEQYLEAIGKALAGEEVGVLELPTNRYEAYLKHAADTLLGRSTGPLDPPGNFYEKCLKKIAINAANGRQHPSLYSPVITGGYNQISWATNPKNGDFEIVTFATLDGEDIVGSTLNITAEMDNKHLIVTSRAENFDDAAIDVLIHYMSAQSSLISISNGDAQSDYGLCVEVSDTDILVPQGYESYSGSKYYSYKETTDADGEASGSLTFSVAALSSERPTTFKLSVVDKNNTEIAGSVAWTITKNGTVVYTGSTDIGVLAIPSDVTWEANDDIEFIVNAEILQIGTFAETDWATIRQVFRSGLASNYWQNGDTKTFIATNGNTYTIRISDMKQGRYELADGSGWSNGVLEFVELMNVGFGSDFKMNDDDSDNTGGWAECDMRNTRMQTFQTYLPTDMLAAISEVKVLSGVGGGSSSGTSSSNNKLFIPAVFELTGTTSGSLGNVETTGKDGLRIGQFEYYVGKTNNDRIKYRNGSAYWYWTRSPKKSDSEDYVDIATSGAASSSDANIPHAVALIFAI